jgi:hypothetical protein
MNRFLYNPAENSDQNNLRWAWLRAVEWGAWPLYVFQPIAPILLLFFNWKIVVIFIYLLNLSWSLIRYRFISPFFADIGNLAAHLKWPISIGIAIYFAFQRNYFLALISLSWPLITILLSFFSPSTKIGVLQEIFMNSMGYKKKDSSV